MVWVEFAAEWVIQLGLLFYVIRENINWRATIRQLPEYSMQTRSLSIQIQTMYLLFIYCVAQALLGIAGATDHLIPNGKFFEKIGAWLLWMVL